LEGGGARRWRYSSEARVRGLGKSKVVRIGRDICIGGQSIKKGVTSSLTPKMQNETLHGSRTLASGHNLSLAYRVQYYSVYSPGGEGDFIPSPNVIKCHIFRCMHCRGHREKKVLAF
jgi:hypothetical protein